MKEKCPALQTHSRESTESIQTAAAVAAVPVAAGHVEGDYGLVVGSAAVAAPVGVGDAALSAAVVVFVAAAAAPTVNVVVVASATAAVVAESELEFQTSCFHG